MQQNRHSPVTFFYCADFKDSTVRGLLLNWVSKHPVRYRGNRLILNATVPKSISMVKNAAEPIGIYLDAFFVL